MCRVISIILYVISGFFFNLVSLLAFVNGFPVLTKFAIMGGFSIPALLILGIGLACTHFRNWKRDVGIVLISSAGSAAFLVLTMITVYFDPEFKKMFPDHKMTLFSDYVSGVSFIMVLIVAGILFIKISKRDAKLGPALPDENSGEPHSIG